MASFKSGSLNKDTYLEWIDIIQGLATDSGIWKFVDPNGTVSHIEPKKPEPKDYQRVAKTYAELNDDDKIIFREDNAQYRVDIQAYRQECKLIGELREKIVDSLHENHRKLIFGNMTCKEALLQIKNRLEPAEDLQQMKIIEEYAKARNPPTDKKMDSWLMEWERLEIMIKRLKMADFSEYKMIQDFLSASNTLLPMWVTNKRMEIMKTSDKSGLKFLDVLLEFRQFWSLTEFESSKVHAAAFPATLQGYQQINENLNIDTAKPQNKANQSRACLCGEKHNGEDCLYLAEGKAPPGFQLDSQKIKKFKSACNRPSFRTFVKKSPWTAKWLKEYINEKWGHQKKIQIE